MPNPGDDDGTGSDSVGIRELMRGVPSILACPPVFWQSIGQDAGRIV